MSKESQPSIIMNEFMDAMEKLVDEHTERLKGFSNKDLTLGEAEHLEARSEKLQNKFEAMGI